jgi:hypothetical protein
VRAPRDDSAVVRSAPVPARLLQQPSHRELQPLGPHWLHHHEMVASLWRRRRETEAALASVGGRLLLHLGMCCSVHPHGGVPFSRGIGIRVTCAGGTLHGCPSEDAHCRRCGDQTGGILRSTDDCVQALKPSSYGANPHRPAGPPPIGPEGPDTTAAQHARYSLLKTSTPLPQHDMMSTDHGRWAQEMKWPWGPLGARNERARGPRRE